MQAQSSSGHPSRVPYQSGSISRNADARCCDAPIFGGRRRDRRQQRRLRAPIACPTRCWPDGPRAVQPTLREGRCRKVIRWFRPKAPTMQTSLRSTPGAPTRGHGGLYGVLGLPVVLGHCQHGHAFRPKQRRGTAVVVDLRPFLFAFAHTTNREARARSQTRPVNGVDVPAPRLFAKPAICLAVRASAGASGHQVPSDCPNPQGYVSKPRPCSSLWRRLFGRISVQFCSMYSRHAARSASP